MVRLMQMAENKENRPERREKEKEKPIDLSDVLSEDFWAKSHTSVGKNLQKFNRLQEKSEYEKIIGKAMIENLDEGVVFITNDGLISITNDMAKAMLNLKRREDAIGKEYEDYIIITDRTGNRIADDKNPIKITFTKNEPAHLRVTDHYEMVRRDGSSFPATVSTVPVIINSHMKGVVCVFHNAAVEKKINEIKSDFISIASHQLRTPVAVSTLEAEMLIAGHYGDLNKEQKKAVESILSYNKKMTYLLNVFMSVSKIELDRFEINPHPTDLRLLLDDIIDDLLYKIKKKRISLRKQFETDLPIIDIDSELMRIVFQNLIANAVNYTPSKGTVTVGVEKKDNELVFFVRDTGWGIPEADKGRLFTKLYRSDRTKKINSEGSGLGLYITKSIVDKCGYKIWFESEEDKGTVFYVSIPLQTQDSR